MKEKYGEWSREDLMMTLLGVFSPNNATEKEMSEYINTFLSAPERASLTEAFREFLLDDTSSFTSKADRALEMSLTKKDALDLFRNRWKILAPDEPCPIGDKGPWHPKK